MRNQKEFSFLPLKFFTPCSDTPVHSNFELGLIPKVPRWIRWRALALGSFPTWNIIQPRFCSPWNAPPLWYTTKTFPYPDVRDTIGPGKHEMDSWIPEEEKTRRYFWSVAQIAWWGVRQIAVQKWGKKNENKWGNVKSEPKKRNFLYRNLITGNILLPLIFSVVPNWTNHSLLDDEFSNGRKNNVEGFPCVDSHANNAPFSPINQNKKRTIKN